MSPVSRRGLRIKTHHFARVARAPRPHPTATLRRERLLIVGCGDVGLRVAALLQGRWRVRAVTRRADAAADARARGATPIT
ncbi:MAG TPA: SDR family NAD(P)-dependent oxidoreductase, partial [Burkholderiaceae bacterium]|nr:SDR family NAD(P)-dependent oxidoreductase [Burkholderiaceae bacterium]